MGGANEQAQGRRQIKVALFCGGRGSSALIGALLRRSLIDLAFG